MYNKTIFSISAFSLLTLSGCEIVINENPKEREAVYSSTAINNTTAVNNTTTVNNAGTTNITNSPTIDLSAMLKAVKTDGEKKVYNSHQFTPYSHHKTLVNYVEQIALDLADTLDTKSDEHNSNIHVAVTTIVDLDSSLNNSNQLGNQISETLIHQLQKFGYSVVDFKTRENIEVNSRGDFAFSRNITQLNQDQMASHVLAGTLIYRQNGIIVNTRVINVKTKQIVASSRKLIPLYVLNKEDIYLSSN